MDHVLCRFIHICDDKSQIAVELKNNHQKPEVCASNNAANVHVLNVGESHKEQVMYYYLACGVCRTWSRGFASYGTEPQFSDCCRIP